MQWRNALRAFKLPEFTASAQTIRQTENTLTERHTLSLACAREHIIHTNEEQRKRAGRSIRTRQPRDKDKHAYGIVYFWRKTMRTLTPKSKNPNEACILRCSARDAVRYRFAFRMQYQRSWLLLAVCYSTQSPVPRTAYRQTHSFTIRFGFGGLFFFVVFCRGVELLFKPFVFI